MAIQPLTLIAAASFALATASVAQDLTADVVRDPAANTATYDFHFNGPPRGVAFLYGAFDVLPFPQQIPGIFGLLEFDPANAAFVCPVVFPPLGGPANCQIQLPMRLWEDVNLHFQGLVIDAANNVALTPLASVIQGADPVGAAPGNLCLEWAGSYSKNPDTYTLKVKGPAGTQVRLLINGGQTASGAVIIPAGGEATIQIPVTLNKGDGLAIEKNGQVIRTWIW